MAIADGKTPLTPARASPAPASPASASPVPASPVPASSPSTTPAGGADDTIHVTDLEAAINHWRTRHAGDVGSPLPAGLSALVEVYARLVLSGDSEVAVAGLPASALAAWMAWYETTPDTPCIAICSTSQGDAVCKGCGRTEVEVDTWMMLGPFERRKVWVRITQEGTALRFNKYAERAARG